MNKNMLRLLAFVSPLKTLRFNLHYFGLQGFRLPVIVYRNFILKRLNGHVSLRSFRFGAVQLGSDVVGIFDRRSERGIWHNSGTVRFNGKCTIGCGTRISVGGQGKLIFGHNFAVTAHSSIICWNSITFAEDVLMSWDCLVMDTDFHYLTDGVRDNNVTKPINVGKHCWIGCRAVLLKGVTLPNNTVVAACGLVTKTFEKENTLIGGNNRVLREDVAWTSAVEEG